MPNLSIVVSVYNAEKYLCECLESLVNQTYKDIEIICVNDGSTDNSSQILQHYASKDKRIKIVSKKNGGLSSARNAGIDSSNGRYITFVDSDDYLELNAYEEAMAHVEDSDLICFGIKVFGELSSEQKIADDNYYSIKYQGNILLNDKVIIDTDVSSCNKIFKREIIDKYEIRYPLGLYYEDAEFYCKYTKVIKKAFFINKYFYNYRRSGNSIMATTFLGTDKAVDHLYITKNIFDFYKKYNLLKQNNAFFEKIFKNYFCFAYMYSKKSSRMKVLSTASKYVEIFSEDLKLKSIFVKNLKKKKYDDIYDKDLTFVQKIFSIYKVYRPVSDISEKILVLFGIKVKIKKDNTNFVEQIFSIKNRHNHKIISIFGFKIKLKNSKLIEKHYRLELDELKKSIKSNVENIEFINKKFVEIEEESVQQNKFLFDVVSTLQELYKKTAIKEQFCIDDVFSNYAVISGITSQNLRYLFYKTEYLQEYCKITTIPRCSLIWGSASWYPQKETMMYSLTQNIPFYMIEDGFLRSADTWCNNLVDRKYTDGISFTISDSVHYFDATRESRMEKLINDKNLIITDEQKQRARNCINKIVETHLTKYNHQPIYAPNIGREGVKKVLVVDQSYGDMSIAKGLADDYTFENMLECAIKENPDADIIVKTHPDTMSGTRGGYYTGLKPHDNIYTQTEPINPISLLKYVDKVYVCTTQFGFEALMCGKEVHVFGMPFYAGWGLTNDRQVCSRRTNKRSLEELFYIAYIMYSYYVNPDKKCRCEIEEAMDYLLNLREEYFSVKKDK